MMPGTPSAGYGVVHAPTAGYVMSQATQIPVINPTSMSSQGSVSQMFLEGFAAGQMSAQSKEQMNSPALKQRSSKEGADTQGQAGQSTEVQDKEVQDIQHQIQALQQRLDSVTQERTLAPVSKHETKHHQKSHATHKPGDTSLDHDVLSNDVKDQE